ncbi:MAG: ABC transporter permease [Bdellovibrionales bacterium]|nr:ABC transporter permease [Bdellovibrionales bacterium]
MSNLNAIPKATPLSERNLVSTPFFWLFYKEVRRFWRVKGQTLFSPLIQSSLYLLIFGVSLGKSVTMSNGFTYMEFLIPGLIMMSALNNSFQNCASTIVTSRFHGDIQDLKIVPLSDIQIISAFALGGLVRGFAVASVTLFTCEFFFYFTQGRFMPIQHPEIFLLFLVLGSLAFGFLGVTTGFWAKGFEHVNAIGGFVLLPLLYLGGVFYSIETLHPFWQAISKANPLLYFVNGVRYGMLGESDVSLTKALAVSAGAVIVFMYTGVNRFRNGQFTRW